MNLSDTTIEKLLTRAGKLPSAIASELKAEQSKSGRALQDLVIKRELINEEELTKLYAEDIGVPYITFDSKGLDTATVGVLQERIARQYKAVVFRTDEDGTRHVAMADPDDVQAIDFIQKSIGTKLKIYIATIDTIDTALSAYSEGVASEIDKVIEVEKEASPDNEPVNEADIAEDSPIAQTVNLILEYAIRSNASDIHIEPREDHVSIRYRIDGVLREANTLPQKVHGALVSRIKILSNLKIDERRVPQDGRFKITLNGHSYAFRVSTLPITSGEKVVMRILNEGSKPPTLEELGYWGSALARLNDAIVQPHGMILITGPTGSGKSTSLFSVLSLLNDPSVNISTVEDPVEYKIPGTNQTQVNPIAGMTFANGLRALLRQDPNIIMVGEIRDGETANLAIQAALTGHLVFSTLHTNNAATCLPRLLDMDIEPFLIASTVRAVIGQRLVRKLCPVCRETYTPDETALAEIERMFGMNTPDKLSYLHTLETQAIDEKLGGEAGQTGTTDDAITSLWKEHEGGCDQCNSTGYKGRVGIYEVLGNTDEVQKLIVSNATSTAIQNEAVAEGMITMQIDGLIKALRGLTSIQEILRVTRE